MKALWSLLGGVLLLGTLFFPLSVSARSALAESEVPSGAYYFSDPRVMTTGSGDEDSGLFSRLKQSQQGVIFDEVGKMADSSFSDASVSSSLDIQGGGSFWSTDPKTLTSKTSSTIFKMAHGSTYYDIYVPAATGSSTNQQIIQNTVSAIQEYKDMIREGVLVATMNYSYNIYTMYPDKQVPLTDILESATDKNGKALGYRQVKSSGVKMNYELDGFYNPIFGKMDAKEVTKKGYDWASKAPSIKITPGSSGRGSIQVDSGYLTFIQPDSAEREVMTTAPKSALSQSNGVKKQTAKLSGKTGEPDNFVDAAMRVIVPSTFTKNIDNNAYKTSSGNSGFKLISDVRLLVSNNLVFGSKDDKLERLGDYQTYGIDDKSLVLYKTTLSDGRNVGAVVPLWYNEAVVDFSKESPTVEQTGRKVKLGNDYTGKLTFDGTNKDLFSVDSKTYGKQAVAVRKFGFDAEADHLKKEGHIDLGTAPASFRLKIAFDTAKEGSKGFIIIRNSYYVDDPDLITWLSSEEAQAITDVNAKELYKSLTGTFSLEPEGLSYKQWNRLQDIRGELTTTPISIMQSKLRIISMVFGVFLIFYSLLLIVAYWVDILNVYIEISFLNLLTFKRLYPISSEEDIDYVTGNTGDMKYVNFWIVLFIMLCGVAIGIVFIFGTPILQALIFLYFKVKSWVSGV
jgi:hypothetical protein